MTDPITPPPVLVEQLEAAVCMYEISLSQAIAEAYAAGADSELEVCCQWADFHCSKDLALDLRDARRPKPPSLKKQAIDILKHKRANQVFSGEEQETIRRALEALPDD